MNVVINDHVSLREPVRLRHARYTGICERQWGLPTGMYVGTTWRSTFAGDPILSIVRPSSEGKVRVEVAPVIFVVMERESFPVGWRTWMAAYASRWPDSAASILPWANITDDRRCELATDMISVRNDPIGSEGRMRTARNLLTVWLPYDESDALAALASP